MPIVTRKAPLTLDFLVVGGGVGGLAVAYVLRNAGHRVRVLEKSNYQAPSGGHRIPPNLSKILEQWVGREELMKVAIKCVGTPFNRLSTGENVGTLQWKPAVMAETGGEFLTMHHDDLVQLLYKLATDAGAQVDLNTEVIAIQQGTEDLPNPSVTLANGDILYADMLIGTDGCESMVRNVVLGQPDCPRPGGLTVYTGVVDGEGMLNDPELRPYLFAEQWTLWMGEHRCFCGHPLRGKTQFFFGIYSHRGLDGLKLAGKENWDELVPSDSVRTDQDGSILRKLLSMTPKLIRTQYMEREETHQWVDSTGRIVLLGDAAHPSYPGGSHTSSMAVEDAVVLGSLFSHLRSMDQTQTFLDAYEQLRQRRCDVVRLADLANAHMMVIPAGPEQDARDESMRQDQSSHEWDELDDGMLQKQFEEISEIFGYDAGDAAEEWWVSWGRFYEQARAHPSMMQLDFSESSSVTVDQGWDVEAEA